MERVKEEGRRRSVEGVWVLFGRLVARLFILPSFILVTCVNVQIIKDTIGKRIKRQTTKKMISQGFFSRGNGSKVI